jgi:hypothetical protein
LLFDLFSELNRSEGKQRHYHESVSVGVPISVLVPGTWNEGIGTGSEGRENSVVFRDCLIAGVKPSFRFDGGLLVLDLAEVCICVTKGEIELQRFRMLDVLGRR